jgi:signal peptidase I
MNRPITSDEPRPMCRRWVGSLLSLLLPGAGMFLAGDKRNGWRWFSVMLAVWLLYNLLAALPLLPGLWAFVAFAFFSLVLTCWMLASSFRPVPKLGFRGWLLFLLLAAIVGLVDVFFGHLFARPFRISSGSMSPTILRNDRILVQTYAYWFSQPQRGDVVAWKTDALADPILRKGQIHLKRVAALPGERVEIKDGQLLVDGKPLDRPAILVGKDFTPLHSGTFSVTTNPLTLPPETYFVVGDNLTNSLDSRYFGPVPLKAIYGRATKIYWPLDRAGDIR